MITKFKLYEQDFPRNGFWLLNHPTEEKLEAAGYKFDLSDKEIKFLKTHELILDQNDVLLAPWFKPSYSPIYNVSWNRNDKMGLSEYKKSGLQYQGELIITEEDIKNITIKKLSRKFNL